MPAKERWSRILFVRSICRFLKIVTAVTRLALSRILGRPSKIKVAKFRAQVSQKVEAPDKLLLLYAKQSCIKISMLSLVEMYAICAHIHRSYCLDLNAFSFVGTGQELDAVLFDDSSSLPYAICEPILSKVYSISNTLIELFLACTSYVMSIVNKCKTYSFI